MSYSVYPRYIKMPQLVGLGAAPSSDGGFLGALPKASVLRPYRGPKDTLEMMAEHALGNLGERSPVVRRYTEWVVGQIWPKAYDSEILAIRHSFCAPSPLMPWVPIVKYLNDPLHVEYLKFPELMVREIFTNGFTVADCDEVSTLAAVMALQCGRVVELVAMGFAPNQLSHVAVRVKEPKSNKWILLDGVAGPREKEAAGKAKEILIRSLE